MKPTRTDFIAAFLRSFAVQGSWNFRTMIGGGMAYALSPLLQRIHAGDPVSLRKAIERHSTSFNAHPYLTPVAIGALARLEHEGHDEETCERFRTALRGPLGALGDQAIWAGWRPLCTLSAMFVYCLGVDARLAAFIFLLLYNVGHVGLRVWGFRIGWVAGLKVGGALNRSALRRLASRMMPVNEVLIGATIVLLVARAPGLEAGPVEVGAVTMVALGAFLLPARGGTVAMLFLFATLAVWGL